MDIQRALKGQYRAGIVMLRQCIELCPDDLWGAGKHPRAFWRIAYHCAFYTHFYLMKSHTEFTPWHKHQNQAVILWDDDEEGVPLHETTYSPAELMEYCDFIFSNIEGWVDELDLDSPDSGFPWYPIHKIDHQLVNIRHLGVHVGQLQELLMARDLDPDWAGVR